MKIKLIAPARKPEWGESFWDLKTLCKLSGRKAGGAPLVLPTLAALTPPDVEVILTDENVESIDFEEKVDLVGITGMTCLIPRSYEIADEYKKRGVPVVMGGIHASMLPEEALQHCDSVVIGEAEEIWGQVVRDAAKKNLKKLYRAPRFPDLANSPIPRWDLLKNDKYCYFTIQTSRGCPFDCDFCSVKVFNGGGYRHKNIGQVIKEIKILQKIEPKKLIFFTDDNLLAVPQYAKELMKEMVSLNIKTWWCQSSMNKLKDDEILDFMYKAGCRVVFVGFESISQKSIEKMNKNFVNKVSEYKDIIGRIHSHKISVFGSFILGSDTDDEHIFEDTAKFIDEAQVAFSMINIITPFVGSRLFEKLNAEKRIFSVDWSRYNGEFVCFKPKNFEGRDLKIKRDELCKEIYSLSQLYSRLNSLWGKAVLTRNTIKKTNLIKLALFLKTLFSLSNNQERAFLTKCMFNKNNPSITNSVFIALSFYNYSLASQQKDNNK
ncbi:MAG: radical SAM protein [Candidatus Omnitrophica bacterium]|nr:radical SAM protein [Candidatus Omnitrophota bacterium]